MDIAIISAISVAVGSLVTAFTAAIIRVMRARRFDRKVEAEREDKRLQDCEARFAKLSDEIKQVRDSFQSLIITKLVESAQATIKAAEVQREGNILQREQTRVLERVCRVLEISAEKTPFNGNQTKDDIT